MPSMIDASCPKCGKRFGWRGRVADRPACPRCGHRPPQSVLEADDRQMEESRALLAARPGADVCRKQRVAAGLTLRQAAKVMRLDAAALSDYEAGRREITEEVRARMAEAYGLDPEAKETAP